MDYLIQNIVMQRLNPSNEQTDLLIKIANNAQSQFLKESRIRNYQSSFTILKILSSFRELTINVPCNEIKSNVYEFIMIIKKYFDPQTYQEWINAINTLSVQNFLTENDLSSQNMRSQEHNNNLTYQQKHNNRNYTVINQLYDQQMPVYGISAESFHTTAGKINISQHIRDKPSKSHKNILKNTCRRKAVKQQKIHFISFEPGSKAMENNKENIAWEDNQPTRTPCSQSFINNLPMSDDSSFMVSKANSNQKNISKQQYSQKDQEEWQNMVARADIFYEINARMKSFSALMANCQAFGQYRQLLSKAKCFYKHQIYHKIFVTWLAFSKEQLKQKKMNNLMKVYYEQKIKRRIFKILSVNYQLKIFHDIKKVKTIDLNKYNTVSCVLFNMFLLHDQNQSLASSRTSINSGENIEKSICGKKQYFIETFDSDRMATLMEYFSKSNITNEAIKNLFEVNRKAYLSKCFKGFKIIQAYNAQKTQDFKNKRQKNFLNQFLSLSQEKLRKKSQNLMMIQLNKQKIKQKIFRKLLEISLSNKLYTKREYYLANKSKESLKMLIFNFWRQRYFQRLRNQANYYTRINQFTKILQKVSKKHYFGYLSHIYSKELISQQATIDHYNFRLAQKVLRGLVDRIKQRKAYNSIKNSQKTKFIQFYMFFWQKKMKTQKLIKSIESIINLKVFQNIKYEYTLKIQQKQLISTKSNQMHLLGLKKLKNNILIEKRIQKNRINSINKMILIKNYWNQFQKLLIWNIRQTKNQRQQEKAKLCINIISQCKKRKSILDIISSFRNQRKARIINQRKQQIMMKSFSYQQFLISSSIKEQQEDSEIEQFHRSTRKMMIKNPLKKKLQFIRKLFKLNELKQKQRRLNVMRKKLGLQKFLEINIIITTHTKRVKDASNMKIARNRRQHGQKLVMILQNKMKILQKKQEQGRKAYKKKLIYNSFMGLLIKSIKMKEKIQQTNHKIVRMLAKNNGKQFLELLFLIKSFRKNCNYLIKLKSVNKLKKQISLLNDKKKRKQKKKKIEKTLIIRKFYKKFAQNYISQANLNQLENITILCQKKINMMRIQKYFIDNMLKKKSIFMAYKFRALKLYRFGLNGLRLNKMFDETLLLKEKYCIDENKYSSHTRIKSNLKIYQHISTEYSSI